MGTPEAITAFRGGVFLALFALLTEVGAQEGTRFRWIPVLDANARVVIRGNQYAPEFAGRDWSISRASNSTTDVTRFEVRAGDQWEEDRSSGENKERTELDGYKQRFSHGTDVWGAYSFLIELGTDYRSDWTAIGQMHGSKARPFHIHFKGGRLTIYSEQVGPAIAIRYNAPVSRDFWHNLVFHMREGAADNGRLEFWLDGKKIVDFVGAVGAPGNQAYWKFGIYRGYGPIGAPFAIQFANMEIGTSELTLRITDPLAIN